MEMSTVSSPTSKPQDSSDSTVFYVYIILGSLGAIGNAFVCLVMLRYRNVFNSSTNKLIIHQSFVDFLASLLFLLRRFLNVHVPPITAVPDNILGSVYCKLWWSEWSQYGMFVTSTYNLVAISLERYFATCQPVRHRNMFSSRRVNLIMTAVWMYGWICASHSLPVIHQVNNACDYTWPSPAIQAVGGVAIFFIELVIPMALMIFAYTKIILELHKRSKARVGDTNQDARNTMSKANKNVIKTLLVVAIFFAICWTPTDVNYTMYNLGMNDIFVDSPVITDATSAIVMVNLCVNPFIYCFTYERFQKQVKRMVCGYRGVNRVDTMDGSRHKPTVRTAHRNARISIIAPADNTNA